MKEQMLGLALIVRREGKVLMHKRKGLHAPGHWGFPGGKFEQFETMEGCALRELREEAGDLEVTVPQFWSIASTKWYFDQKQDYFVIFMICDWIAGEPVVKEPTKCESWDWFSWNALPEPLLSGTQVLIEKQLDPFKI